MRIRLLLFILCLSGLCGAQQHSFPFGAVTYDELNLRIYDKDTAAAAVVLNEFGEAYIDNSDDHDLVFHYHVKIKILKKSGLDQANVEIPLYRQESYGEKIRMIEASTFNIEHGSIVETKLVPRNIFTEDRSKYWNIRKFALPNVRVGSVIEFQYELSSPFFFHNFRTWEFQSDIPKLRSEYWATIPANYVYNISLKGFLKLSKDENKTLRECFTPGGGQQADCARYMWAMEDIPAFIEEDYMTARSNFLSAINFELSEVKYFSGRIDKITKEWKDAEEELRRDERFGLQLKRGKDIVEERVAPVLVGESDPLKKAQKIYDFMVEWYRWNSGYGKYSEQGIKRAFDGKTGNSGDINLSLIAALRYAGLNVEPMILSTRENGLPTTLYPVLSDFNYVIAKLNLGDKVYLLDATDDFMPFGLLPERCLNGQGRVLGEKESYWYALKPANRAKQLSMIILKLDSAGVFRGTIQTTYLGYKAVEQRKKIYAFGSPKEYVDDLTNKLDRITINQYKLESVEDFKKPLVEKFDVAVEGYDNLQADHFLFNPFIIERWERNPFKSSERLYPVDFGAPLEETVILNLEYPAEFEVIDLPKKVGIALPNGGGHYIFEAQHQGNKLVINNSLLIGKTVFTSTEYHYLKELFNQIIQVHGTDLIFRRKI